MAQQFDPTTGLGQLQGEINSLRLALGRKAESHEVATALTRLDRLEHSVREIRSLVDGLVSRLQGAESQLETQRSAVMSSADFGEYCDRVANAY